MFVQKKQGECEHEWVRAHEDFVTLVFGTPNDLGEEIRFQCVKCKKIKFERVKDLGSLKDMIDDG